MCIRCMKIFKKIVSPLCRDGRNNYKYMHDLLVHVRYCHVLEILSHQKFWLGTICS